MRGALTVHHSAAEDLHPSLGYLAWSQCLGLQDQHLWVWYLPRPILPHDMQGRFLPVVCGRQVSCVEGVSGEEDQGSDLHLHTFVLWMPHKHSGGQVW